MYSVLCPFQEARWWGRFWRVLTVVYNIQNYWVFGPFPSPPFSKLENTTFAKLDLSPFSGERRHLLCWVSSNEVPSATGQPISESVTVRLGDKSLETSTSNFIFQRNTCGCSPCVTSWVILRSVPRGTHDHILLSQIRDSPNLEGQVFVFISPRNMMAGYTSRHWVAHLNVTTAV
jgi:hypothetical protein